MNPGVDPLDPLELALLMEAAEDLSDLDRHDPPPGKVVASRSEAGLVVPFP